MARLRNVLLITKGCESRSPSAPVFVLIAHFPVTSGDKVMTGNSFPRQQTAPSLFLVEQS